MPELYTTQVRAEQVQAGTDQIVRIDGVRIGVDVRTSRTKWTEIDLSTGETMRVENTSLITVERERKTEDEKAAERRRTVLEYLDHEQRVAANTLRNARDKAATALLNGEKVTSWNLLDVVAAQALAELWARFERGALYQAQRPEDKQLTLLEVLVAVRDDVQERLLNYMQLTSRSTSQASNLVEDCEREVQLRWLRDTSYAVR